MDETMTDFIENKDSIKTIDWKKNYSPDNASKGMLLFLILQILVTMLFFIVARLEIGGVVAVLVMNLVVESTFIIAVYAVAKKEGKNFISATGFKGKFKPIYILLCIAVSVISLFAFSSITNLFMEIMYRIGYTSVTSEISIPNFGYYAMYVVLICVLPAICEEILFRGLIYSGLSKISRKVGIFGSAFLFMLVHGSPDQTVHQFILGVILALSFEMTRTIWVPILIHFFNNFIAISLTYFYYTDAQTEAAANSAVATQITTYILYALLLTIVGIYLLKLVFKGFKKAGEKTKENNIHVRDLSTGGTIESEILHQSDEELQAINSGEESFIKYKENIQQVGLSSQGKIFFAISITWMALEWISALVAGFGYVIM